MEDDFTILPTGFWKSLIKLSALSTSNVSDEWRSRSRLNDHGGLSSSRGHKEIPGWTAEQNQSPSNGNRYLGRGREEPESARLCEKICNTVRDIRTFTVLFSVHWPFALQSLTPLWFAMLCLCFVSAHFNCKICFEASKYWLSRAVWNIPWTCFKERLTTQNHELAVLLRVSVGGSLSGRNNLLLRLPTGVLSLPLTELFFLARCFSRWAPTNWSPGRGYENQYWRVFLAWSSNLPSRSRDFRYRVSRHVCLSTKETWWQLWMPEHVPLPTNLIFCAYVA